MRIIRSVAEMQTNALHLQAQNQSIGFIPTMGALHEGHLALVRRARDENDAVIVSIFVNPMQFGPKEDLIRYPRTLVRDQAALKKANVDILFAPSTEEMYPAGFSTFVDVPSLNKTLCGPLRPHHFRGVATVVAKLFQIVQPTRSYFGEKDIQQVRVIDRMIEDLRIPTRLIACPTVREKDGLAVSSRNRFLSRKEREEAVKLYQALYLGRELVSQKIMTQSKMLVKRLTGVLATIPHSKIDYIAFVDPLTLEPMEKVQRPALLAIAIWIGKTRLIDNVVIS